MGSNRSSMVGDSQRRSLSTIASLDLVALESFVAVAEELHFGRAASRVHLSQPALTHRIQRLEPELAFALFTRDRRHVVRTPAGAGVLERSRPLLAEATAMVDAAADVASGRVGTLRVGHVGSALYGAIPPVVRWLRDRAPALEVSLVEYKTAP